MEGVLRWARMYVKEVSPWIEVGGADLLDDLFQGPFLVFVELCNEGLFPLPHVGGD